MPGRARQPRIADPTGMPIRPEESMKRTSLIRTVAVVAAEFAGGAQAAEMTIFQGRDFRGPSYTLKGNANLADIDFQNKVSSIVVRSGTWDVCTEPDLAGQCATLYPGE